MSDEWLVLFQKSDSPGCVELVRHFSVLYVNPSAVRIEEIIAFTDQCVTRREQTILSADKMQWGFQNLLIANKYVEVNPIAAIRRNKCGTSIKKFPEDLRQEAEDFFSFMASDPNSPSLESSSSSTLVIGQDVKVLKRRKASSKVTIEHLERILGEVYGFLVERKHPPIKQLSQMFTRTVFERYGNYLKEREVQPNALRHTLLAILTAARQYLPLVPHCAWVDDFLSQIEIVPLQEIARKKQYECKSFPLLESIPDKIRKDLLAIDQSSPLERKARHCVRGAKYEAAWLAMEHLLISMLLSLPWYTQNIIGCKLGRGGNLFKDVIDPEKYMYLPDWVVEKRLQDTNATFWQYRFSSDETRGAIYIHCILPKHLVSNVDEFVNKRRRELVGDRDPGTLFVDGRGKPLTENTLPSMITEITLVYAGVRTCPKQIRDSLGFEYLKEHPNDYAGLCLLLWHHDPEVTEKSFDTGEKQSRVTTDMERWHEKRFPDTATLAYPRISLQCQA